MVAFDFAGYIDCPPEAIRQKLMINTVERFFSNAYSDQETLFAGLEIWKDARMRRLAGIFPVVKLSFSSLKSATAISFQNLMVKTICSLYQQYPELKKSPALSDEERTYYGDVIRWEVERKTAIPAGSERRVLTVVAAFSVRRLCELLFRHFGKKPIVLLDEYDTPMQEAWTHGYWDDITPFMRQFMNATFKDNDYLERGLLTGITRVSKESILSDLNNLMAVTTTSESFSDSFGFTEAEVFAAMDEYGLTDREGVKRWYDGFTFGSSSDIYNPWSITNYLHERRFDAYWVNTSSNALVGALIQRADAQTKSDFEVLLGGGVLTVPISENISFKDLDSKPSAIWSLLLASGYLRVVGKGPDIRSYAVAITNLEVQQMFLGLVENWFDRDQGFSAGTLEE